MLETSWVDDRWSVGMSSSAVLSARTRPLKPQFIMFVSFDAPHYPASTPADSNCFPDMLT
jgi:hypothetical protein